MIFIKSDKKDVYFNLAMEEYFFNKFKKEDIFILWVNSPSVVVGKHQNLVEEVNLKYCYENNINIARRLSGGGTVFHDEGNLNYSYITNSTGDTGVDFKEFIKPIYNLLKNMDINVEVSPRNDLRIDGFKICGHAEYMRNKRVLHHGCLLFDTDLKNLSSSLKIENIEIESTAVKSVRSKVCNIKDKLEKNLNFLDFLDNIEKQIYKFFDDVKKYNISNEDILEIENISKEKYVKDEWIYGLSPKSILKSNGFEVEIVDGKIVNIKGFISEFCESELINQYYKFNNIKNINIY